MAKISLKDSGRICSYVKAVVLDKPPALPKFGKTSLVRLCNTRGFNNNTYLKTFSARTPLAELLRKPENIQAEARLKECVASLRKHKHAPFNHFNFLG